jgi:sec-independent protein translocase protein TatA
MGEGLFQPTHLLLILVIALFVFGPKKLPELGKGLGEAIRGFKDSFRSGETPPSSQADSTKSAASGTDPNSKQPPGA